MKHLIAALLLIAACNGAILGANKCTQGPAYWCQSLATVKECPGSITHCTEKVWKNKQPTVFTSFVQLPQAPETDACTFCKDVVADVKNFLLANDSMAKVESYMKRACGYMPDDYSRKTCTDVVDHYMSEFIQMIKDKVDPQKVCSVAQLCGQKRPQLDLTAAKSVATKFARVSLKQNVGNDTQMCKVCKNLADTVKQEIDNTDNQKAIIALVSQECEQLGSLADECKSLISQFAPQVFAALDQELDQACYLVGLCTNGANQPKIDLAKYFRARIAESGIAASLKALRVGDKECDTCEEVFGYLRIFLNNNATEQQLQQMIDNELCSQMGSMADMCKSLVDQYLPQAYAELMDALAPAKICTEIGMCKNSTAAVIPAPEQKVEEVKVKASMQCVLCEYVMDKLDDMLITNKSEAAIEKALDQVCDILPKTVRSECESLVAQYGPAIAKMIANEAAPKVVCSFLGLCASGDAIYAKPLSPVNGENCIVCELAMKYVKSMLSKNATEVQILQKLEQVCNYLSGDLAKQCNSLIAQYGPEMLKKLADDLDAKTVCTELGLCSATTVKSNVDGLVHLYNSQSNV